MKKMLLAILGLILFSPNLWASETLLYAIRHESLKRYPDIVSTKIYSLDPNGRESRLIFSDENATIMLLPRRGMPGHPGEVVVSSKNRIYAHAVERRLRPGRWYSHKASIYELSSDGSNRFRKSLEAMGEQSLSEMFVNSAGTQIGYINYLDQKTFIFIHDIETGRLVYKIDVSPVFLDCFASSIGWLPDGKRLFFTLDTGDVHVTSEKSYKQKGTYFINEDGTGLMILPEEFVSFPLKEGYGRTTDSPPRCIGVLSDGTYLFRDARSKKGYPGILSFIYGVNPATKSHKEIPLTVSKGLNWFKVSHSGKHIAFTEKIYSRDGSYQWVEYLWIKDLLSGEEKKVFTLDNIPFKGSHLGLVGWVEH